MMAFPRTALSCVVGLHFLPLLKEHLPLERADAVEKEDAVEMIHLVLEDAGLTAQWQDELDQMRARIAQVRAALGEAGSAGALDLMPVARGHGMFATLPLSKEQIQALRDDHGIYMAGSGRINVAGLTMGNLPKFVEALAAVTAGALV